MSSHRCIAALACLAASLGAQQFPSGADLTRQSQDAVKAFHSLQYTSVGTMQMGPMKIDMDVVTSMVNPGKSRMEMKFQGMSLLTVSDGNTTWVYHPMSKSYVKKDAALGTSALISALGVPSMPDVSKMTPNMKTTGEEVVEVDGQKRDCWIVETRMDDIELPNAEGARIQESVSKIWIDKKLLLDMKMDISVKMKMPKTDAPMEMQMHMVKKDLKINPQLADSLFTFTIPPDAKEVDNIMGGALNKSDLTGKAAPAFEVKGMDGKSYSLASLKGKPVLLDFWATWCGPCRKSMPALEKLYDDYKSQGLVVLGVNTGEDRDTVAGFLETSPMPYPAALSGDSGILDAYRITAFPTFVMIGTDGTIVAHEIGFGGDDLLTEMANKAGLKPPKHEQ